MGAIAEIFRQFGAAYLENSDTGTASVPMNSGNRDNG